MLDDQPLSRPPPSGVVTFLFTDIEGSTRRWEEHPEAMEVAVARHDELLRSAIERHDGYVFKTIGDAFCATFEDPLAAVLAAWGIQRALADEPWGVVAPIRVRAALHAGAAEIRDRDYFGPAVNRVARLLSAGHGGQVLLSGTAVELLRDRLPDEAAVRDLGAHQLKDLTRPERIHQLLLPDLPDAFPPLRTLDARRHNLPVQLTSFVDRAVELAGLKAALADHRLVTLTGIGGSGKSRLALQAAADLTDAYPDGVWLVELAAITDRDAVTSAVLDAIRTREESDRRPVETLLDELRDHTVLLILDNCEHLLQTCADLARTILASCESATILATSREGLGLQGETIVALPSLPFPDEDVDGDAALLSYPAMELLLDRARAVRPDLHPTHADIAAAAQIVRRLDGIPLALELAAARVKVLSLGQIADRLHDRFRLLTGGGRSLLPRQQTLQAAMDWSHDLLTQQERVLLRRLAVFSGGWQLESAERVCEGDALDAADVLDVLSRLVDRSLIVVVDAPGGNRYRLLETVRQYAMDRLAEAGEVAALRGAHARHFLDLVEDLAATARDGHTEALDRLEEEHGNLRAAFDWTLQDTDPEPALRMATSLGWVWFVRGDWTEASDALARAVAAAASPSVLLARAHAWAAVFAWRRSDLDATRTSLEAAREALGATPDTEAHGLAQLVRSLVAMTELRHAEAESCARDAVAAFRSIGGSWGRAVGLAVLGEVMLLHGADPGPVLEEALSLFHQAANPWGTAFTLSLLAHRALLSGDLDRAAELYGKARVLIDQVREASGQAETSMGLFHVGMLRGDPDSAAEELSVAERLLDRLQDPHERTHVRECRALLALARGDAAKATALFRQTEDETRASGHVGGMGAYVLSLGTTYERHHHPRLAAGLYHHALQLLDPHANRMEVDLVLQGVRRLAGDDRPIGLDEAMDTTRQLAGLAVGI
ncbi:MAG TPA: adenylate/guanylate cyclase domain-containing protein [Nitriliruptorales bacterium]|nr:adenylate/guanylate cyclase domain-containing protein [Nitriliruptorales bacterium]